MNFNIAAAILVVGISAMVISKVGDILVPEEYFTHKEEASASGENGQGTGGPKKPDEPSVAVALASADVAKGQKLVQSKCKSCHTWTKGGRDGTGPNLWGVVERDKGSADGYSYSSAMKEAKGNWDYENLYEFLKRPSSVVKGTKMSYRLRKYKQRADVIAFLRTQADVQAPLPKAESAPKQGKEKKTDAGKKNGAEAKAKEATLKAAEEKKKAEEAARKAAEEGAKKTDGGTDKKSE